MDSFATRNMFVGAVPKKKRISARIPLVDIEMAKAYIQGAVHSHCKCCKGEDFSVRELFGGDNKDWNGTPLQVIYNYYLYERKAKDSVNMAAKDVGWLLLAVLDEDSRKYELVGGDTGNRYILR